MEKVYKEKFMYKLFCDSNCELNYKTVAELGLTVIKMPYYIDNEEYFYDMGEKHDFKGFFDKMRKGAVSKTMGLNEYDYTEYFEPVLKEGKDVYYITFSHEMSGTFAQMFAAIKSLKEKYPEREIRYINTKLISMGSGVIAYYGALKYNEGATMDELDAYLTEIIKSTATYFMVEDLTYLYRGGRISSATRIFGNLLGIKPILHFNDEGKIVNIDKQKGTKKALSTLVDFMKQKGKDVEKHKIIVLHADAEESANIFIEKIKAQFPKADILLQPIGPVIGSHCGPGTIGVVFNCKQK